MKKIQLNNLQYRFWIDDLLRADNAYNLAYSFKFQGNVNIDRIKQSLLWLINEYEPFHSTIQQEDLCPYFIVQDKFELPLSILEHHGSIPDEQLRVLLDEQARTSFDLSKELPCKFILNGIEGGDVLLAIFHHLVMDGITIFDFCNELTRIYNALSSNECVIKKESLFETYNNSWTQNYSVDEKANDIIYWTKYLEKVPMHIPLPQTSRTDNRDQSTTYFFNLGEDVHSDITAFCKEEHTTSFRLFSGVWLTVLHYFLQTDKLVLDHTIHLRPQEYPTLLGSFVNNLPIKVDMEDIKTFHDLLTYLRDNRHQEKKHQRAIYTDIVSALRTQKRLSETNELFNIGIDYPIRNHSLSLPFVDCIGTFFYQPLAQLIGDMCLVIEDDENFTCSIRYKSSIDKSFIESMAKAFDLVLKQVISFPNVLLSDITYLSQNLVNTILVSSENAVWDAYEQQPVLFLQQFEEVIRNYPKKSAILFNNVTLSYQDIHDKSNQIAQFLLAKHIVNQYIGIAMKRGYDMIIAALAIWKSGNTYVPLDLANPVSRLKFIIEDCNIQTLFIDQNLNLDIDGLKSFTIDTALFGSIDFTSYPIPSASQNAYVIYTSGTTGRPKGIPITHRKMVNALNNECEAFHIGLDSIVLQFASINFDASIAEIFTTLSKGGTLVIANEEQQKDPTLLLALLDKEQVSCATIPPTVLTILPHANLPYLKTIIVGGESTPADTVTYWSRNRQLINAYGPTENTVDTAINVYKEDSLPNDIGNPILGVSCYILDKEKRLLPDLVPGELYIGGIQLTEGYINRPELNQKMFIDNPFVSKEAKFKGWNTRLYRSGDLVMRLPNGHLLFLGRTDYQVKIRGLRIELGEIENHLVEYQGIQQAFVTTIMMQGDKQLAAYVQANTDIEIEKIRDFLLNNLPSYMVPNYWSVIDKFPLTINGKIDRLALPEPQILQKQATFSAPTTTAECLMTDIVTSILNLPSIGIDDNLFDMGISSLQVMETVFAMLKVGIHTTVSTFYEEKTIRKILTNNKSLYCYWVTDYNPRKPVLLLICGYAYFKPYHEEFANIFKEDYSILVIESFHDYFFNHESCTLSELLETYMMILRPILKDKTLAGITGFCLGGEIGLQLAYYMSKEKLATPKVFVIDGFAGRGAVQDFDYSYLPGVDTDEVIERNRITELLEASFFFNVYEGETYICLADTFSPLPKQNVNQEDLDPKEIERAFNKYSTNPELWKEKMPHCKIHYIHSDHWNIIKHDQCLEIKGIIDRAFNE